MWVSPGIPAIGLLVVVVVVASCSAPAADLGHPATPAACYDEHADVTGSRPVYLEGPAAPGVSVACTERWACDEWRPHSSLLTPRRSHTASTLPDGRVLVAGGELATAAAPFRPRRLRSTEILAGGQWHQGPELHVARAQHQALQVGRKVLFIGGADRSDVIDVYDPDRDRMSALRIPVVTRDAVGYVLRDGRVFVTWLADGAPARGSAFYHVDTGSWVRGPDFPGSASASRPGIFQLFQDRVTVTTHLWSDVCPYPGVIPTAWSLDLRTLEWQSEDLPSPNFGINHVVVEGARGEVLLLGGYLTDDGWPASVAYDPATRTWTDLIPGLAGDSFVPSLELPDGRLLLPRDDWPGRLVRYDWTARTLTDLDGPRSVGLNEARYARSGRCGVLLVGGSDSSFHGVSLDSVYVCGAQDTE